MESARCKAFVTAAETGSFSKAGEVLGYTPSGVSQLVTSLERELGLPLLGRNRKGVTLTENGRRLLPAVREFLQQENRIYQLAGEMSGLLVGSVTIATYSSVATHWLPQVIRRFRARYPHIQIKLMEGIRQEFIQWLEDKAADLAFFSHKAPMPYDWIPLAEDRMVAVLPPGHPLADRGAYPLAQCAQEDFIMPALGRDDDVLGLLETHGLEPKIAFTTLDTVSALAMIQNDLGMSIMNELITKSWPGKVAILPLDPPQQLTLGVAVPSLPRAAPAVKAFLQFAVQALTQGQAEG